MEIDFFCQRENLGQTTVSIIFLLLINR